MKCALCLTPLCVCRIIMTASNTLTTFPVTEDSSPRAAEPATCPPLCGCARAGLGPATLTCLWAELMGRERVHATPSPPPRGKRLAWWMCHPGGRSVLTLPTRIKHSWPVPEPWVRVATADRQRRGPRWPPCSSPVLAAVLALACVRQAGRRHPELAPVSKC